MVSSSLDAIRRVVEAFERSEWSEIDVRLGDVRVHLATGAPISSAATTSDSAAPPAPSATSGGPAPDVAGDDAAAAASERQATASAPLLPTGAHVVESPSPGILWRSPEPGAPPFADIGDVVDASETVCIVEVMKLMNHVKARVSGEIVAVCVENGMVVRKGEPLFAIAPSGSSS